MTVKNPSREPVERFQIQATITRELDTRIVANVTAAPQASLQK
jgi:hypothetical protein